MLAASPVPVEPLQAHRVALRAALCGLTGAFATEGVALPLVLLSGDAQPGLLLLLWPGGGAVLAACFAIAVELAHRLPLATRLAAFVLSGALAPGVAMCALLWCYLLIDGSGPERAWGEIMRFLAEVTARPRRSLPGTVAVTIPFALAGAAHTGGLPGLLGRVLTVPARVALAAITGAVACTIAWLCYPPRGSDHVLILGLVLVPPALEVAIALALRGEARLLAWWAKRREAA